MQKKLLLAASLLSTSAFAQNAVEVKDFQYTGDDCDVANVDIDSNDSRIKLSISDFDLSYMANEENARVERKCLINLNINV